MILFLARQALAYLAISPVDLWFHGGILARKSQWGSAQTASMTMSIEDLMTGVREHWSVILQFYKTLVDQLLQMIWVDGQQGPHRFDVSKLPNEVDGLQSVDP